MRFKICALAVTLLLAAGLQSWFAGLGRPEKNLSDSHLSGPYTEALARGQAHLLIKPHPAVLAARDPFVEPEAKQHLLSDSSYYNGRYYIYFGIVPFAMLLVPWYWLTGVILSPAAAVVCFSLLGYTAYGLVLLRWTQLAPSRPRPFWFLASLLVLMATGGMWPLLGRPAIYEIENAAAHAFMALSVLALFQAETGGRRFLNLAAASGFAALTMGCRPSYFPAVTVITLWVLGRAWQFSSPTPARRAARVLGVLLPLFLVAVALAGWNYHRFGTPLEFGLRYTVSQDPSVRRPLTELANVPYSAHRYLLGGAHLSPYFPFIQSPKEGPVTMGPHQEPSDQLYGFLWINTALLGAFFAWRARPPAPRPFLGLLLALFLGNFGFMLCIPMSCYRYPADLLGPLALLAALGWWQAGDNSEPRRRLLGGILVALLAWSLSAVVCQTFSIAQTHLLFDTRRPDDFARVARPFNRLAYAAEFLTGRHPGAVALTFTLPAQPSGPNEPLVVLGAPGAEDFLFINYVRPGLIVVGYESTGQGGVRSAPIELDLAQEHRLELHAGSLLPPDDHPLLRATDPTDRKLARELVVVSLDGKVVIDGRTPQHPPRGQISLGRSPTNAAFGAAFTGKLEAARAPLHPLVAADRWAAASYGPVRLKAQLVPLPAGVCDPLLSLGLPGQGAQLLAEHQADGSMKLIWLDATRRQLACTIPSWPMHQSVELEIHAGSLLPPPASPLWPRDVLEADRLRLRRTLRVILGGKTVLEGEIEPVESAPALLAPGRDTLYLRGGVMPASPGQVAIATRLSWP